jgi:hypothetical protein
VRDFPIGVSGQLGTVEVNAGELHQPVGDYPRCAIGLLQQFLGYDVRATT